MNERIYDCIDAGTENCPCYLALTGDCLTCSRLAGKDACDCNWRGVCIYNELKQNNGRVNNLRQEFTAGLVEKRLYLDDLVVFVLDVGRGFALKCAAPGSYIFMRRKKDAGFYDAPISVMRADVEKGYIHVAVKIISAKTKALLEEQEAFVLRGVYRNGIQGVEAIRPRNLKNASVLLVAKGIGFAPAVLAAEALGERNRVDLAVDTEKISQDLVEDYLEQGKTIRNLWFLTLSRAEDREHLRNIMRQEAYQSVAVLASDYYVEEIGKMAEETLPEAAVAVSNNFTICCGEGVCGACSVMDAGGEIIKMCKCQRKE